MNSRSYLLVLGLGLITALAACRSTAPAAGGHDGTALTARTPGTEGLLVTGNISALNPEARTVTIKMVWKRRTFAIAPGCEIITAKSRRARLTDLHVGDPVEATYLPGGTFPEIRRLAVRGVTKEERKQAQEHEQLEKILTPNPSERPTY